MKIFTPLFIILVFTTMTSFAQSDSDSQNTQIKIDHIALSVTDLEESEQFYRDVIGLKQIPEPFQVGRHAWFDLGGAELHVIRAADERIERDRSNHLCFSVADLESFIENISSHGLEYFDADGNPGEINIRPDGIQQIYFTDPDGYWIEINDAY